MVDGNKSLGIWFFCFLELLGFRCFFHILLVTADIVNAVLVDLHGLRRGLRPLYLFFVDDDLLNEQPQQFQRQLRDVRTLLRLVEESVRLTHRFPQVLDLHFLLRDSDGYAVLFLRVTVGKHLKLLHRDATRYTVLIELFEDGVQFRFHLPYGCQFLLLPADLTSTCYLDPFHSDVAAVDDNVRLLLYRISEMFYCSDFVNSYNPIFPITSPVPASTGRTGKIHQPSPKNAT